MKTRVVIGRMVLLLACGLAAVWAPPLGAQVPGLLSYQGRLVIGGTNYDGNAEFKFALVNAPATTTYWSNDNSSTAGSEPAAAVTVAVNKGLYSVLLGDSTLPNMVAISPAVFGNADVRLRVWYKAGTPGFNLLAPDQRLAAVGYALVAATVPDGAIAGSQLAPAAVTGAKIASTTIESFHLVPDPASLAKVSGGAVSTDGSAVTVAGPLSASMLMGRLQVPGNTMTGADSTVSGGTINSAGGQWATVGGGTQNTADGPYATIAGGANNMANSEKGTVGGGGLNAANGVRSTIGGGLSNNASGEESTISGGSNNTASGHRATVAGGNSNAAQAGRATVSGGAHNTASAERATVAGGFNNLASGEAATVPGGTNNIASGNNSLAAGQSAQANHPGTFVWSDSSSAAGFGSSGINQFLIRAAGGVGVGTSTPAAALHVVAPDRPALLVDSTYPSGTWLSLRNTTEKGTNWHFVATATLNGEGPGKLLVGPSSSLASIEAKILTLDAAGRVGIQTDSPTATLEVNGDAAKPGGGAWAVASDARLKRDVQDLHGALDSLLRLRSVTFEYADPTRPGALPGPQVGFLAQEVETVFPDWVATGSDGYKYVSIHGFEALAVEALRELRTRADGERQRLESCNAELQRRVRELEREAAGLRTAKADMDARLSQLEAHWQRLADHLTRPKPGEQGSAQAEVAANR